MRLLTTCFLVVALLPSFPVVAQISSTQKDRNELRRLQSQAITDDLLNDARQLPTLRRAEILTRIGHNWWLYDQRQAGIWIGNAIDIVQEVPIQETGDERRQRLETARQMLKFVSAVDQKLSGRLVTILGNKEVPSDGERIENAQGLIDAARGVAQHDPKRGAELGARALRLGPPTQIAGLFNALYQADEKLAEDFLLQAIATAKQDSEGQLLNSLTYILFPTPRRFRSNTPPPASTKLRTMHVKDPYISPDNLRLELLQLDIAFLKAGYTGKGIDCASVLGFISPVMDEFERLIPEQAGIARQVINDCGFSRPLPQQSPQRSSKKPVLETLALNTVETLLEVAAETNDVHARTSLKQRAAILASTNSDHELAFKILDDMSPEERKSMGKSWAEHRSSWAVGAAIEHYRNGRIDEMNLILNGVPSDLQPFAKTGFVAGLVQLQQKPIERDLSLRFLHDARAALRESSLPEIEKYASYFAVMQLLVKYDPPAAGAAFKEAVDSLNRAEQMKENKDFKLLDCGGLARTLPLSLIEMDEIAVKEGINSIASVESRVQLRLEFLGETLRRIQVQP